MAALLTAFSFLVLSFLVQLVVWRVALPRRHTPALVLIFAITPVVATIAAWATGHALQFSAAEAVRLALFYISFALAYIGIYSAIEMESASLAIIVYVAGAGNAGCDDAELSARFGQGSTIAGRFAVIERGGWVRSEGDTITLSPEGRFWAIVFESASRLFGLSQGG